MLSAFSSPLGPKALASSSSECCLLVFFWYQVNWYRGQLKCCVSLLLALEPETLNILWLSVSTCSTVFSVFSVFSSPLGPKALESFSSER